MPSRFLLLSQMTCGIVAGSAGSRRGASMLRSPMLRKTTGIGFGLSTAMAASLALAASQPVTVELNRLDAEGQSCRASFVITNPGPETYTGYRLDLVVFDKGGTIVKRLAADIAPIRSDKETVKVFDIPDTPCTGIGSILGNDVLDCRAGDKPETDCAGAVAVSSKLAVKLLK
jgi:hypothetical protein